MAHHLALGTVVVNEGYPALDFLGLFETELLCSFHHQLGELPDDFPSVSLEDFLGLSDILLIVFIRLFCHTWGIAEVQVVFQTGLVFALSNTFLGHHHIAGTGLVEPPDEVEHGYHRPHVAVRPVVGTRFAVDVACLENTWKGFVGDADAGVGLAVFQQDVVAWLVFLDETVLQQQGIFLGLHYRILDVPDLTDEYLGLESIYFLVEIGGHPPLQVLCLTHIDDYTIIVEILVTAWLLGHVEHDVFQSLSELLVAFVFHRGVGECST